MKRLDILSTALAALLLTACGSHSYTAADFDREVYTPAYATGFDIRGRHDDAATLVTVRDPWQGARSQVQRLLILRNGAEPPAGFDGQVVAAPVSRVVCLSSSHVALFDALGEVRRIKGVSGIDYIANPYIREHRPGGEVRDIGYDTALDFETLAALQPQLAFIYGVAGENGVLTGKLRELNIPYIYIGDYLEPSPLGKAEWLMVAAEVCDCPDRGREVFGGIAERYNTLAQRIGQHVAEIGRRPKALLNTPYRDTWFMPPARNYMVRLIRDAGGDTHTVSDEGNASLPVDMEQACLLAAGADVWLNVGSCRSLDELKAANPRFADIPAVRSGQVFNNDRRRTPAGGSDFWESGATHPDLILRDLAAIFHPDLAADTLVYYRQLR